MSLDPRLVLVRHGETLWTEGDRIHGRRDAQLSPTGIRHSALTAQHLRGDRFEALYASRRGRALQTAAFLGSAVGLQPRVLDGVEEADYGLLEGRRLSLFEPDGSGARWLRPVVALTLRLTGEPPRRMERRVAAAAQVLIQRHPSGSVLLVTHWGVLSMLMATLVEGDPGRWRQYGPWTPCGITELRPTQGRWIPVIVNDSKHLQGQSEP
jgi:probable phosphoglycerate mutase